MAQDDTPARRVRQYRRLKKLAGPRFEFLGNLAEAEKNKQYACSRRLLFLGEEDFGIIPVEARSFGAR
jgi:hypothetical protein